VSTKNIDTFGDGHVEQRLLCGGAVRVEEWPSFGSATAGAITPAVLPGARSRLVHHFGCFGAGGGGGRSGPRRLPDQLLPLHVVQYLRMTHGKWTHKYIYAVGSNFSKALIGND